MKTLTLKPLVPLLFTLIVGCAHQRPMVPTEKAEIGVRLPAQAQGKGCFEILGGLFKSTRVSRQLKKDINLVADKFGNDDGHEALRVLVDRLQEEVARLNDEGLEQSWLGVRAIHTRYSEKVAANHTDFSRLKAEFLEESKKFMDNFSSVRRPKVANQHQERLEMYRSMIDRPNQQISTVEEGMWSKEFRRYIAYKDFVDDMSLADKEELQRFSWWAQKNIEFTDYQNQRFEGVFKRKLEEFRKAYKSMSKSEKQNLEFSGKESSLKQYNELADQELSVDTDIDKMREDILLLAKTFGDLEPQFRSNDFLEWLFKEEKMGRSKLRESLNVASREGFNLKLGDFVRQSYKEYAPFQNLAPPVKKEEAEGIVERVKAWLPTFRESAPECESLECVMQRTTKTWKRFFQMKYYKDSLSCLAHNPVVLKSMVMDMGIVWATLYWHYRNNAEEYQRFPFEIIANGAVFAPILAEANCRASFKGALPFGDPLPKSEVFTSRAKRFTRSLKNWNGIAFKGFVASMGLMTMTYGFDHLMLALGHEIAKPLALNNMLVLLPITYLYHGAWMGIKNMAVINPIRHKIIPRMAKMIERKTGLKGVYWPLQTGLDFGIFKALLLYNSWDYLFLYQDRLIPMVTGAFSAGVTLEHKREVSKDGETLDTFEGVSEAGIATETVLSEEDGKVKLESLDVDVKDEELESWVDQMLGE